MARWTPRRTTPRSPDPRRGRGRGTDREQPPPVFGPHCLLMAVFSALYAIFHMAALNGVSISRLTGIEIPVLPSFPMETWNFRIVHIAGALALGFLLFSADIVHGRRHPGSTTVQLHVSDALVAAALFSLGMALSFAVEISNGELWNGIDPTINVPPRHGWFGIPLLVATFGAIILAGSKAQAQRGFRHPTSSWRSAGFAVAAYLIDDLRHPVRNSVGTPFVPIGMSFAAVAGTALILELTRRVAGLALVIITGVFLIYTFTAHLLPGILNAPTSAGSASSAKSTPMRASSGRPRRCPRPTSSCSSSSRPSCRPPRWATTSSTSPSPRRAARAAAPPRSRSSPPA